MCPTSKVATALSQCKRTVWDMSPRRKHTTTESRCESLPRCDWQKKSVAWAITLCSHSDHCRSGCLRIYRSHSLSRGITWHVVRLMILRYGWLKHTAFAIVVIKVGTFATAKYGCNNRVPVRCGFHSESVDFCLNTRVVFTVTRGSSLFHSDKSRSGIWP